MAIMASRRVRHEGSISWPQSFALLYRRLYISACLIRKGQVKRQLWHEYPRSKNNSPSGYLEIIVMPRRPYYLSIKVVLDTRLREYGSTPRCSLVDDFGGPSTLRGGEKGQQHHLSDLDVALRATVYTPKSSWAQKTSFNSGDDDLHDRWPLVRSLSTSMRLKQCATPTQFWAVWSCAEAGPLGVRPPNP